MENVQFEEDDFSLGQQYKRSENEVYVSKAAKFLMKRKIAKNHMQASILLLVFAILSIIFAVLIFIFFVGLNGSSHTPGQNLPPNVIQKINAAHKLL